MGSVVLGVDIGSKCGWAVFEDGELRASGLRNFKPTASTTPGQRLIRAANAFDNLLVSECPDAVYFEQVRRFMSSDAAYVFCGIMGQLLVQCELRDIPCIGLSPTEIKKHATGSGRATKEQMIAAVTERFGIVPRDDNEADAIFIASLGAERV